jgi:hypothetical protein
MHAEISDSLKSFINASFDSVGQVEVLLLLYATQGRYWTAREVGDEMRSSEFAAESQLRHLAQKKLVTKSQTSLSRYTFDIDKVKSQEVIQELSEKYSFYRVAIISLIYNRAKRSFK